MRDPSTEQIIGAVIEVHRILGPRPLELIYEEALCHELAPGPPRSATVGYRRITRSAIAALHGRLSPR